MEVETDHTRKHTYSSPREKTRNKVFHELNMSQYISETKTLSLTKVIFIIRSDIRKGIT